MSVSTASLFSARLTPHRSMGRKGMRRVVVLALLLALVPGLFSVAAGAWPVIVFTILGTIAIAWALRSSLEEGKRRETVTIWPDRLELVAVNPKGAETRTRFNPAQIKLIVERDFDERTTALKLRSAHGDTEIGAFLTSEEKASFARALGTALRKARVRQPASKPGRGA